jgi:hypothetical protein
MASPTRPPSGTGGGGGGPGPSGPNFLGGWDATLNSPALADGVGTSGDTYKVTVAGATLLDGISDWDVNDYVWFDGALGAWTKLDTTDELVAVVYDPTGVAGDAFDADNHAYSNATSGLTATDTQAAIDEIEGRIDTLEGAAAPTPPLIWGAGDVGNSTTTRYLFPGYDDDLAQTVAIRIPAPRAGNIKTLRVVHNGPAGNGSAIVYTLRVGGVASALTASLASTGSTASDLVNTVAVLAGDLLDIEITKAAGVGTSPTDVTVTVEYEE